MGSPGWMSTRGTANTLVLIGIHSGSRFGSQAASLLLDMCPTAALIVFGSVTDIDLLSAAYARGRVSLLIWESVMPSARATYQDTVAAESPVRP